MIIQTKFLGELEIEDSDIITFEQGMLGFSHLRQFYFLAVEGNPYLSYMQSLEDSDICFITIVPAAVVEEYNIEICSDTVEALKVKDQKDVELYAILNIHGEIENATVNLKAPVVINRHNKKAVQELLNDDRYDIKHPLVKES